MALSEQELQEFEQVLNDFPPSVMRRLFNLVKELEDRVRILESKSHTHP